MLGMRCCCLLLLACAAAHAFVALVPPQMHPRATASLTTCEAATTRREPRTVLQQGLAFGAAAAALAVPGVTWAEGYEDLSADDAPAAEAKAPLTEEERVKRKLELQAQATGKGSSGRKTYQERTSAELAKQKAMKRSSKQRQEDLCEKLGRGC